MLILSLSLPAQAVASSIHSSADPDPANTLQFKTISLKNLKLDPVSVPENCDGNYRAILDTAVRKIWQQCESVGKSEPSSCQRDLSQQCAAAANKLRALQPSTCKVMISEASEVQAQAENQATQASSQESNSRLNSRAKKASETIAAKLEGDTKAIQQISRESKKMLGGITCLNSSASATYLKAESVVAESLNTAESQLTALSNEKKQEAKGYSQASDASKENQSGLKTTATGDTKSSAPVALPEKSSSRKNNLLPLAAVGLPAIALLGLSASGSGGNISGLAEGVDSSGIGGNAPMAPVGKFQVVEGLSIDPSFTDREKATIVEGYRRMPDCYKPWIKNIAFVNKNLGKPGGAARNYQCVAGRWTASNGRQIIYLSPSCYGTRVADVIHEYMHSIGFRNGHRMHGEFKPIRERHGCYVSEYAKTSLIEDFAETSLQAVFPSPPRKSTGPCIGEKVDATRQLLQTCK